MRIDLQAGDCLHLTICVVAADTRKKLYEINYCIKHIVVAVWNEHRGHSPLISMILNYASNNTRFTKCILGMLCKSKSNILPIWYLGNSLSHSIEY